MKPLQIFSVVATLLIAVGLVSWLASSAPSFVVDRDFDDQFTRGELPKSSEQETDDTRENPFDLETPGPHPVAEVPVKSYIFGNMEGGQTGEHDFVVRNAGSVPLKIAKGPSSCKCTLSEFETDVIAPGDETTIHVSWSTETLGLFAQDASIWTNDPEHPKINFRIEGRMNRES